MPILDLCERKLVSVKKSDSIQYVAQMMRTHHVGSVIVVSDSDQSVPVGIVTDRDIALGAVAENLPFSTRVQNIMSSDLVKIESNKGIAEAVDQMEVHGVRRMIVIDESGKAVGLVTSDDIVRLVGKELNGIGKLVERQLENEKIYKPLQSHFIL